LKRFKKDCFAAIAARNEVGFSWNKIPLLPRQIAGFAFLFYSEFSAEKG